MRRRAGEEAVGRGVRVAHSAGPAVVDSCCTGLWLPFLDAAGPDANCV